MKNLNFCQTIELRTDQREEVLRLLEAWDEMHATADVMGYIGTQVLEDRSEPGRYMIVAEFAQVEPGVSAAEEAAKNNDRPETQEWAARMYALTTGDVVFHDWDEIYRTG